jgi:putative phosphoesterase
MTKIAILSDIHGNIEALNAVLNDINMMQCDRILCTGDLVGYGPRPNEVIELIRELNIPTVMGNYDEAVGFKLPSCGCHIDNPLQKSLTQNSLKWSLAHTQDNNREFLRSLPEDLSIEIDGVKIYMTHSTPDSITEYVYPADQARIQELLDDLDEQIYIYGHTHIPFKQDYKNKIIINAGSVGRPKQGDIRANYTLLQMEGNSITVSFPKVSYPVQLVAAEILASELDPYFADFLLHGGDLPYTNCDFSPTCKCSL